MDQVQGGDTKEKSRWCDRARVLAPYNPLCLDLGEGSVGLTGVQGSGLADNIQAWSDSYVWNQVYLSKVLYVCSNSRL